MCACPYWYAAAKHVNIAKRWIRVIKECSHCVRANIRYAGLPKVMRIYLVYNVNYFLNALPPTPLQLTALSPLALISGRPLGPLQAQLKFGEYCKVQLGKTMNSMDPRTFGALVLASIEVSGVKGHGGWWFLPLDSMKPRKGFNWTRLPIPESVQRKRDNMDQVSLHNRV